MKPSLSGKVTNVEAESEYRGTVYERTVSIETATGVIDCFEGKSHITNEDYDTVVDVILLAQPIKVDVPNQSVSKRIEQNTDLDDDLSKWHCTLYGEVCSIDVSSDYLGEDYSPLPLIDVGTGAVLISTNDKTSEQFAGDQIQKGTMVQIDCSRLDIVGRNNTNTC